MLTNSFKGSIALGMISEPAITVLNKFFQQSTSFKSTSAGIRMILRNCGNTGEIIITQTWSIFTLYIAVSLTLFFVGLFVATNKK